jgi:uncharacterized membrane protein
VLKLKSTGTEIHRLDYPNELVSVELDYSTPFTVIPTVSRDQCNYYVNICMTKTVYNFYEINHENPENFWMNVYNLSIHRYVKKRICILKIDKELSLNKLLEHDEFNKRHLIFHLEGE